MTTGPVARTLALLLATSGSLCGTLPAQSSWRLANAGTAARIDGGSRSWRCSDDLVELPAGDYAVHFPVDSAGKPESLQLSVAAGETVAVAISRAGPAASYPLLDDGDSGNAPNLLGAVGTGSIYIKTASTAVVDPGDHRLTLTMPPVDSADGGLVGLVARYQQGIGCYLVLVDRRAEVVRLERWMGGDRVVLMQADVTLPPDEEHQLALQLTGFRLQVFLDDARVAQLLDGAMRAGDAGVAFAADGARGCAVRVGPPAVARPASAVVRAAGSATFHAAAVAPPGSWYRVDLVVPCPHPAVPRAPSGLEPWLLQPPTEPIALQADWLGLAIAGGIGELGNDGRLSARLRWRTAALQRRLTVTVRAQLFSASGEGQIGAVPAVPLAF